MTKKLHTQARRLHTHTVVFDDRDYVGQLAAIRALQGLTTKAIATELGITESKAQYAILKAQKSIGAKFRSEYRSGAGPVAKQTMKETHAFAKKFVQSEIAPQFEPFAQR